MFVTIDGAHMNMECMAAFGWNRGEVRIVSMDGILSTFQDPEKKLYKEMCEKAGVEPLEEE